MEVKNGYKMSEIGVIPEDWEIKKLGELANGVEYGSSAKSNQTGKVPVLRMGNIQNGKIVWDNLVFTDNDNEISKYLLKHNDILFNRTNTIDLVGKTSIYKGERQAIFAGYLIRIKWNSSLINPDFLNYQLNAEYSKKYSQLVLSVAIGQANINGQKLKTYPIPVPPTLTEQRAIASALSDTDALIAALDRLIAKKKAIKQGAMQELLRPKEGWVVENIQKIGTINGRVGWKGYTKKDLTPTGPYAIGAKHIDNDNRLDLSDPTCLSMEKYLESPEIMVFKGDILLVQRGTIGKVVLINKEIGKATINPSMLILRLREISPDYVFYYLISSSGQQQIISDTSSTGVPMITQKQVLNFKVPIPPTLAEQTNIATILTDMDAEITTLERQRDKYKAVKQGMMQELLTGKTRLI